MNSNVNSDVNSAEISETIPNDLVESQNDTEKDKQSDDMDTDSVLDPNIATDCSESSNEDSVSNSGSTEGSLTEKLRETLAYQQNILEQNSNKIKLLELDQGKLQQLAKDLELKLEVANRRKDAALKEKEAMVVRYAVSEKNILKEQKQKESIDKKLTETQKELEILQHRIQTLNSEKSRICQMLDNKHYENKLLQQELEQKKQDLAALENKLKWSQNNLKTEIENHRDTQAKLELLTTKHQELTNNIDNIRKEADDAVKSFHTSEDNRAFVLDKQVKEQQASLILLKHEKNHRDEQMNLLQKEVKRLQSKQKEMLQENNALSLKVQHLEKDRSENESKLSELRGCADQQRQDVVHLQAKSVQLEQLKSQLKHEQDQLAASNEQMTLLKQRNLELEADMETCRVREAELLLFTQQLTEKNVRLQSEFTSMETRVQQLSCEQTLLKRQVKEHETRANCLSTQLNQERIKYKADHEDLNKRLKEVTKLCEEFKQEASDQKSENVLIKRKFDMSLREVNRELQHCHKKMEVLDKSSTTSTSSSNSSLSDRPVDRPNNPEIDQQTLIEHIVKLQKISAKKSEKIDFLEEHVNTLVIELQKKSKLLQSFVSREQKLNPGKKDRKDSIKVG
ncbi:unnamed protein product [Psylliodes chrysocephalus]|uniref:Uncharacterized protein n=1 Tax=Psylliodes chrysocephalus TaxID=3402493 RepID=A0A9P0CD65_9CUCU|nr:unnamed protein product [Psylliodes chrysocephala]